jgi:hypothetical protein
MGSSLCTASTSYSVTHLTSEDVARLVTAFGVAYVTYHKIIIENGIDGIMLEEFFMKDHSHLTKLLSSLDITNEIHQLKIVKSIQILGTSLNAAKKEAQCSEEREKRGGVESSSSSSGSISSSSSVSRGDVGGRSESKTTSLASPSDLLSKEPGTEFFVKGQSLHFGSEGIMKNIPEAMKYYQLAMDLGLVFSLLFLFLSSSLSFSSNLPYRHRTYQCNQSSCYLLSNRNNSKESS